MPFDQKFLTSGTGCFAMAQTDKKTTDGHGDSMTELAQWADSVQMGTK